MSNKHTPGPWHIDENYHTSINNGPANLPHKHIAMVNFFNSRNPLDRVNEEEHQANVYLIAAAPELLEELEKVVNGCEICDGFGVVEYQLSGIDGYLPTGDANFVTKDCPHCSSTRVIIAKAKGE